MVEPCQPPPERPSEQGARSVLGERSAWLLLGEGHLEQLAGRGCSLALSIDLLAAIAFDLHTLGPLYMEGDFLGKRRQNQDSCPSRLQSCCTARGDSAAKPWTSRQPCRTDSHHPPSMTPCKALILPSSSHSSHLVLLLRSAMFWPGGKVEPIFNVKSLHSEWFACRLQWVPGHTRLLEQEFPSSSLTLCSAS